MSDFDVKEKRFEQYKFDRAGKDAIFAFKERVLVHFAIDLTQVYMTTRLEGEKTCFLPFNSFAKKPDACKTDV